MKYKTTAKLVIQACDKDLPGVFGHGCVLLLQGIAREHSLNRAAKSMGMAYSKAWRIVNEAEGQLDCKLIERDGAAVERFRTTLFDFGLPFTCKEFKNERRYVERAEFDISCDVSVSARWRADFAKGVIMLETRNLERLGSALYTLRPQAIDQALLDHFGHLVLGQPNRFRELAKR